MPSKLCVVYAVAWRRVKHMIKYRLNFIGTLVSQALALVFYLVFLAVMDVTVFSASVGTTNIAAFMFLGIAFVPFINVGLWESSVTLASDMELGKLEYTFTCPISRYWFVMGNTLGVAATNAILFAPMFSLAVIFAGLTFTLTELALGLLAIGLSVLVQIGTIFSSLVLRYRKVSSIFGILSLIFQFLAGTYVPIQTFPFPLRIIALTLPNSFGIDLLRVHLMGTTPMLSEYIPNRLLAIITQWVILVVELLIFVVLAKIALIKGEKAGLEQGFYYL
ncbi:MAG: ABC transporter permease [Candidatus Ranarchaeia archaeon]